MFGNVDEDKKAKKVVPQFATGLGVFDTVTASFHEDKNGRTIQSCGVAGVNVIAGPPNSFKTEFGLFLIFSVLRIVPELSKLALYDSEQSFSYSRLEAVTRRYGELDAYDFSDENITNKLILTQIANMYVDEYFNNIKTFAETRGTSKSDLKEKQFTTPFVDFNGEEITQYPPMLSFIDSMSKSEFKAVSENFDKNMLGDGKDKPVHLNEGFAKSRLVSQMPSRTSKGIIFTYTAHVGDIVDMSGGYAPEKVSLSYSKKGRKTKGNSSSSDYLSNNYLEIWKSTPLHDGSAKKLAKYPYDEFDNTEGTTDLNLLEIVGVRNKAGSSGYKTKVIVSQSRGILTGLTDFYHCKEVHDGYGISGNNVHYHFDLLPDVSLSRTKVNKILSDNPIAARAAYFTASLKTLYMTTKQPDKYRVTPKELYEKLDKLGYDWNKILQTRYYWTYRECEDGLPEELNVMNLLEMYNEEKVEHFKNLLKDKKS